MTNPKNTTTAPEGAIIREYIDQHGDLRRDCYYYSPEQGFKVYLAWPVESRPLPEVPPVTPVPQAARPLAKSLISLMAQRAAKDPK